MKLAAGAEEHLPSARTRLMFWLLAAKPARRGNWMGGVVAEDEPTCLPRPAIFWACPIGLTCADLSR